MVKQWILIGCVGLLIAFSNASQRTQPVEVKYAANTGDGIPNVVQALRRKTDDTFNFNFKQASTAIKLEGYQEICPKNYMYCTHEKLNVCVQSPTEVKNSKYPSINLTFKNTEELNNAFSKKPEESTLGYNLLCEKEKDDFGYVDSTLFKFLSDDQYKFEKDGLPKDQKAMYCAATFKKNEKEDISMHFVVEEPKDVNKKDEFKKKKEFLNKIQFRNVKIGDTVHQEFKSIKCYGFSSSNLMFWILEGLLLVFVGVGIYLFFFHGNDEDNEKTFYDENSAVNP